MQTLQQTDLKVMTENQKYSPGFVKLYRETIVPALREKIGYKNALAVPRLVKISLNMGIGEAVTDSKIAEVAAEELGKICGQKPKICRSRKPISNFKLKKGVPVGCCVTLRKAMMYDFFERLIAAAIPRIRDFRGFGPNSFDGKGNYTFGLTEQTIFPEINLDKVTRTQGMNITIHTSANTDDEARELMRAFGFPFRR